MNYRFLMLFFCLWSIGLAGVSQDKKPFGVVDKNELAMTSYVLDPSASAVVLFDVGKTFLRTGGSSTKKILDQHKRIKILKKEGYDYADIEIPYYTKSINKDKIRHLKAQVYVLENGEIKTYKLKKSDIIDEKINQYWSVKKLSMPHIREGAIVEYSYRMISEADANLFPWEFQTTIPVKYSEFTAKLSAYRNNYFKILQDVGLVQHIVKNKKNGAFMENTWAVKNAPKFVAEKYMTEMGNHIAKIEFQLKAFLSTWRQLDMKLLNHEQFGKQLRRKNFGKALLASAAKVASPQAKAKLIYDAVRDRMAWNKKSRYLVSKTLKKAYDTKEGSSADINLLLVNLLSRAGIEVTPVILSTRSHEEILMSFPLISKFNYVIAAILVGDKGYLLDATDKLSPFGLLPFRCLSGAGRIITRNELKNYWTGLYQGQRFYERIVADLKLDEEGMIKGDIKMSDYGYSALASRKKYRQRNRKIDTESYVTSDEDEKADLKGLKVLKAERHHLNEVDKPLKSEMEVSIDDKVQKAGDLMYLNPMLYWQTNENPFKLEKRRYPVDFGYTFKKNYYLKFTLPKGYKVESLPESKSFALPSKGGGYFYSIKQQDGYLMIISRFAINKPVFNPSEYTHLKEFFAKIVDKQAEQIVLKKE